MNPGIEIYIVGSIDKADPCAMTMLVKVQNQLWSMAMSKRPKLYRLNKNAIGTFNRDLKSGKIARISDVSRWIDGIYDILFDPFAVHTETGPGYKHEFINVPKKKGGKR